MKYINILKNNFITHVLNLIIGFATTIMITRSLLPESKGYIDFIILVFVLIGDFGHLGITDSYPYIKRNTGNKKLYSANNTFLISLWLFITTIIIISY